MMKITITRGGGNVCVCIGDVIGTSVCKRAMLWTDDKTNSFIR